MLFLEDLIPGRRFETSSHTLTEEELLAFAHQFDPQFFHTDHEAAKNSVFDGLAASGWHTSSLSMRLVALSELGTVANGLVGMDIISMRWPRPTRAGDTLTVCVEVLENRRSNSQPGFGIVTVRWTTTNQRQEIAMQLENRIWVQARGEAD
ncbi:MaoC domain protein dehydratase [Pseudogulbenkiania sp. NH8B]|uniref:MaoC family dehydratase n=1 Tax=Pseudogulbenkiania sp. (strain NH8B) TaxID=748280 RepID=UPI0002279CEB|nr:MaoC family dehydratase [Pseudogulbenkiania sp. NH8B]BAK76538.1 MaoC domain protein dehydratase [Pseudogulbenkiania sp. NH8B]